MDRYLNLAENNNLISNTGDVPIALSIRDNIIDCEYYGSAVLTDEDGNVLWSVGNEERLVFERSLVKPFKALALIREGVNDAFSLDEGDIAIIAGSHSGTNEHIIRVKNILNKCGLSSDKLKCGKRLPIGEDALVSLAHSNSPVSSLHCDCSGEHAGVLALCRHLGFSIDNYMDVSHPIQEYLQYSIKEFTPDYYKYTANTIDRCGMPMSAVPLRVLADRFGKLVTNKQQDESINKLLTSIVSNPYLYTGHGRLIGELIARSGGRIIGKEGAEGVYTIAWIDYKISLAVKVGCGIHRAALPIIVSAAKAIGLDFPNLSDCINSNEFAQIINAADY